MLPARTRPRSTPGAGIGEGSWKGSELGGAEAGEGGDEFGMAATVGAEGVGEGWMAAKKCSSSCAEAAQRNTSGNDTPVSPAAGSGEEDGGAVGRLGARRCERKRVEAWRMRRRDRAAVHLLLSYLSLCLQAQVRS